MCLWVCYAAHQGDWWCGVSTLVPTQDKAQPRSPEGGRVMGFPSGPRSMKSIQFPLHALPEFSLLCPNLVPRTPHLICPAFPARPPDVALRVDALVFWTFEMLHGPWQVPSAPGPPSSLPQ